MSIGINTYFPQVVVTELAKAQSTEKISFKLFDTPGEALEEILKSNPDIIAFGEYHPQKDYPAVDSPLKRFRNTIQPRLKGKTTDLIMETWVIDGKCKEVEKKVAQGIKTTIKRPASTENEIMKILILARNLQIKPHILKLTCKDYDSLLTPKGEVDYGKLMILVRRLTEEKVKELYTPEREVSIYGGVLHTNLYPKKENRKYSYGPALNKLSQGKYVEVDLVIPEYIDSDPELNKDLKNEEWFPIYKKLCSRTKTLLINPKPNSYILIFPRTI